MLEEHQTIKGKETKAGLMPVLFLGKKEGGETPAKKEPVEELSPELAELKKLAEISPDIKVFQKAALKIEAVASNDELMAQVLDDGPDGFYAKYKS